MKQNRVVVSQSMYFPWVGILEQIRLADTFVHYDDVQFSKGSFSNRVQVKTPFGMRWLSLPLKNFHFGQKIDEVELDESKDWRSQHRNVLRQAYLKAPYLEDMLSLVERVFTKSASTLADVSRESLIELANYFGLNEKRIFVDSKMLRIEGAGSQRVLDIVLAMQSNIYLTGHGARNYLDHQLFEKNGIDVHYMHYRCIPYPQLHGEFTPFVTALDLVANCGKKGTRVMQSETINWKEFIKLNNG